MNKRINGVVSMPQIYINLPVKNLDKSVDFFTQLGFKFNPQFTDENAACMIINGGAFVMLISEDFFMQFTNKELSDSATETEAIISVSANSRGEVDEIVNMALMAGAQRVKEPMDQDSSMYAWSFQDLDNHIWEVVFMEPPPPDL